MPSLNINGTSLEYVEFGNGDTVLFVHGSNSDYRTWEAQLAEFAKSYHAVALSRRYHWPNEKISEGADYSMAEHVNDLQQFIHLLDKKPIHLVGHSYGAFVCLLLAMKEPKLIRTLVLIEPPIFTLFITIPPKPQQILRLLVTRPRTALAIIKFATSGLNPAAEAMRQNDPDKSLELFAPVVLGEEAVKQMSAERLEQAKTNNFKAEFLGSGFLPLDSEAIRRLQIPTLLVTGAKSPRLFHLLIDRLDELLPNSEIVDIPAASHISHEDNPLAYNAAVLSFIKRRA